MAKPKHVQGMTSSISDLVLRDGSEVPLKVGGAIIARPTLVRTMGGAGTISLEIHDSELHWLKASLSAEKFDAKIDGLWFRYLGTSKSGKQLTLTFEDRDVANLRELKGPKKAFRVNVTRAEFIVSLVREVRPKIDIYCPQLHVKQPIKTKQQAKKAKDEGEANRGKGIGDVELKIDGAAATSAQKALGHTALQIAESVSAPFRVQVALIEALMAESSMGTASPGNVLEALEPYTKIRPAEEEISGFLTGDPEWTGTTAIGYYKAHPSAPAHEIAQAVQKSEFPDGSNYAKFESEAREWVEAFSGGEGTGSIDVTEPYTFEVGKKENYWEAIQRLAKEVNWRAFVLAGRFFYMPEDELFRSKVRLAINPDTEGIEDVDFDYHRNKAATTATVSAFVEKWGVPPACVVTLAGYGPASIGFGDAPVQADGKGRKQGISNNRNAKTGEGRSRYLVSKIEVPIAGDAQTRLATISLRKPTEPLPEPAPETHSLSASGGAEASADALGDVNITSTQPGSPYWGGAAAVFKQFVHPFMEDHGLSPGAEKEQGHAADGDHDPEGQPSGYATDYPTNSGEQIARALAQAMGNPSWQPNSYASFTIKVDGYSFDVQILWGAEIEHGDHIHVGMHRV